MTWTLQEMKDRLTKQNDKCAVSGLPMTFSANSDWQCLCSPERLCNHTGYTNDNGTFVCFEFQLGHRLQASVRYVRSLCLKEDRPHPRLDEIMTGNYIEPNWVPHCSLLSGKCLFCRSSANKHYRNTVHGQLISILSSTIKSTNLRNSRGRAHTRDIDYQYLQQLMRDQEGKCAYSGHHLGFKSGTLNCISLERIDVNLGYIKGNVCFIMACLNTSDYRSVKSLANLPKSGGGGWSKAKVEYLRKYRNENPFVNTRDLEEGEIFESDVEEGEIPQIVW